MAQKFWESYWSGSAPERLRRQIAIERVWKSDIDRAALGGWSMSFGAANTARAHVMSVRAQWTGGMENVYRVRVDPNVPEVEVACLGLENIDREAEGIYKTTLDLPEWMQAKIAVLNLIKVNPPQEKIEGVGMRVDENVFWVIKGE